DHIRVKRSEYRLVEKAGTKRDKHTYIKKIDRVPDLLSSQLSPIQRISKTIMKIVKGESEAEQTPVWSKTYNDILKMKKEIDNQSKSPGARVYDLPMDQLVFDKVNLPNSSSIFSRLNMPQMVDSAFSLADSVREHTSKTNKDNNIKMLSPRFAPVLPDKDEGKGLLSPSILAFYKVGVDDAEDQILPLPELFEASGMKKKDRESMLEMIMEVSGARRTVDEAFQVLRKMNLFGVEGPFLEVTNKIQESFTSLEKSFTRRQKAHMKKRQFAFLDSEQLKKMYEQQGIKEEHREEFDMDKYHGLNHKQREEALWKRIGIFAANQTEPQVDQNLRQLSVLAPTVLAPYMFTPIYGLTILGPVVLSPSLFSPLILNPSVLSPYVLSPAVGMPFILSPYLLSPYVLSPLVMAPFILTPYVLSPNVINPYVLSPLILSPLVLCPDVLSPMVLGGNILSPSVGSPSIFSKSTLMASVLSPSVLS
ncbi:hypothetical protein PFISCL1PPCAC_6266, partial [Pristionchus fissidentatus]